MPIEPPDRDRGADPPDGASADRGPVADTRVDPRRGPTMATRIIRLVESVLLVLLLFRFGLALLGANPANAFANAIYSISWPFVAPFNGVFGYTVHYGIAYLELFTLVAMAVYALVARGLIEVVNLSRP